jgi:hypothetical protein
MIKAALILLFLSVGARPSLGQQAGGDLGDWFLQHIAVAHSMQTADLSAQPAQFQLTFPHRKASSYLINAGVAVILDRRSADNFISNLHVEYHRNTLTDAAQNNFSAGYGYKWLFARGGYADYFMTGDAGYSYDGISHGNSLEGTFLFTLFRDGEKLNWNTNNFRAGNRLLFNLAPFAGLQVQDVFKAEQKAQTGFVLRPLFRVNTLVGWCKKQGPPFEKILAIFCNYTGRTAAINTTGSGEHGTGLLQTGINYYLAYHPFEASLGVSFNDGSDPLRGLPPQQYWMVSVNFLK